MGLNSGKSLLDQSTLEDVYRVDIQLKDETEEQAALLHKPVYGMGSIQWGVERDSAEKRKALWFIVPFKDRVSRFLTSNKESSEQTVELDMQYDRETISQKVVFSGRLGSKTFREEQIDVQKSDRVCTVKDHDNSIKIHDGKLHMLSRRVFSPKDYAMNESFLRVYCGNAPVFHRAKLSNFNTSSKNIHLDGSEFPLEDVEKLNIEVLHKKVKVLQ